MTGYLGAYAGNFTPPGGQSRSAWEADRKARILPRNRIGVDVSDVNVTITGDRASARFKQGYTSDSLSVTSTIAFSRRIIVGEISIMHVFWKMES